jgi:hypothetical protein
VTELVLFVLARRGVGAAALDDRPDTIRPGRVEHSACPGATDAFAGPLSTGAVPEDQTLEEASTRRNHPDECVGLHQDLAFANH